MKCSRLRLSRRAGRCHAPRLELHYQPLESLADGSLVGSEALARWRRADLTP